MITLQHVHLLLLQDNKTPLHYAVERGEQSIVYALIDKEASIHFLDKVNGFITVCTLLQLQLQDNKAQPCYIVKGGNLSFAQVLCDKEASIDCIDKVRNYISTYLSLLKNYCLI